MFADVRAAALTYVPRSNVFTSITPKFFSGVASATTLRDYFPVVIALRYILHHLGITFSWACITHT